MNPSTLRKLMESKFDGVERIYMEAEKEHQRKNRVKSGGNRKMKYTEGWVEFDEKSTAKRCALLLNAKQIGGKKMKNMYYDDLWTIKYLSKFKWSHLTEKLQYDQKMREVRLKKETHQAKKDMQFYEEKRTLSKRLNKMEEKRIQTIEKIEKKTIRAEDGEEKDKLEEKRQKNLEKMFKY